jgi:transposase
VLECRRGEESIAELCRWEGINPNLYYKWSKEFLEAGKVRLTGDTKQEANSSEVTAFRLRFHLPKALNTRINISADERYI